MPTIKQHNNGLISQQTPEGTESSLNNEHRIAAIANSQGEDRIVPITGNEGAVYKYTQPIDT